MIANPQGVKFVLSQAHLFKPTFPSSKQRMIGPHAFFFHDGPYHAKLRKLVLASFLPDSIRHVVPAIEQLSIATLESWVDDDQGNQLHGAKIINTFMEIKKVYTYVRMSECMHAFMHVFFLYLTYLFVLVVSLITLVLMSYFSNVPNLTCCKLPHIEVSYLWRQSHILTIHYKHFLL